MNPERYLPRSLPPAMKGLTDLALDLRWNWNHCADALWKSVDPERWEATEDPWLILESISRKRLEALAADSTFLNELHRQLANRQAYLRQSSWFYKSHDEAELGTVAYFSMEFGLSDALPIYSGGLGVLAGDFLKTASDLGIPLVGIGLLYQQGYFHQALDTNGDQLAFFPYNNPTMLPVLPLQGSDGEWLRVSVELPGRTLWLRGWQAQVGRVSLYLLDSNDLLNAPGDRGITGELYGGGIEMRLQQEIVLGIGGWRLLEALNISPLVCHLNEGHAAFVILERARRFMEQTDRTFSISLLGTRAGNIFTTHTPVAAGFDRFPRKIMTQYFSDYAHHHLGISMDELLSLGHDHGSDDSNFFNMAYLALRGCGRVNGVSRLHGEVCGRIFLPLFSRWPKHEIPISHITNGVHMPSWDSAAADALWTEHCGKGSWLSTLETIEQVWRRVDDDKLWSMRNQARQPLVKAVRRRLVRQHAACGVTKEGLMQCLQVLDPNVLTIGFARRFAGYKRPTLLLADPDRLTRLLIDAQRPVQLIIAGKAHPQDEEGKRMVREWNDYLRRPEVRERAVFLEDYDMGLAAELVQGVDLWLNTPRRPWEASGTSGMKVLVNGGLNLSELDGWWAEAYDPEVGWSLGDGQEHDHDAAWDAVEAEELYMLLEEEVVPAFYTRDEKGIPTAWMARMRQSLARLTPMFSCNRMAREYTEDYYIPAAAAYQRREAGNASLSATMKQWEVSLANHWHKIRFGQFSVQESLVRNLFQAEVHLGKLEPAAVQVELYAEALSHNSNPVRVTMDRGEMLAGSDNGYLYHATVPKGRPSRDYTPRVIPYHLEASVPLEANFILWWE
ncbi:alpha-glucan family phosphorylase [Desulfogranum marinum]|uniref:alpha-glucan family phosphorylase n=1 Tax=Desulfogranum marinum TaxID=453220 RepID=UPI001965324B|nr:alpha-glucan family phosphorylase [Desulfogranum marinum]MBM9511906.1 alpha-glucan family phosphorylase [Desulfogranum marinum]